MRVELVILERSCSYDWDRRFLHDVFETRLEDESLGLSAFEELVNDRRVRQPQAEELGDESGSSDTVDIYDVGVSHAGQP